ncbi:TRAP transporter small permease subunit [Neolewinella antarctica]|uniref:TRAP-type mannitol/chloroaromatic compound transport system permease small subunit n=1 Tax=Neolewinella antarctica TaxID=442734 RepID=A0ABX0X7A7_9BACT|nr:TRAP transporter small permease subunit [Neolewinella antarctica]NJC25027.1 TRAP-type mannitol/chloroaromatic compound transport system permease small subunit [Neolewinella antarctica]
MLRKTIKTIEALVEFIGKAAGYFNLMLIAVIVIDVALRTLFSLTGAWVIELEWHLFAVIFLLGIPYAMQQDRHVRVDLFYERFTHKDKRLVNLLGTIVFLLPWAAVLFFTGWHYAAEAFATGEGSPNPNGIPYFFPVKAMIPFAAGLLVLQGMATGIGVYLEPEDAEWEVAEDE